MTDLTRLPDGQLAQHPQMAADMSADKWALLDALTHAAVDFGLTHRTLAVLRALLTFFPDRDLPQAEGAGVVYPSNRILSERLNGMPESTLRRHLATLVRSGLVMRRDSANRKRFARFGGVAFGFDLSPLARAARTLAEAACRAQTTKAQCAALRAHIATTRQQLLDDGIAPELLEDARLCQRRKLSLEALTEIAHALDNLAQETDHDAPVAMKMSGRNSQNERHIQTTDQSDSVSLDIPAKKNPPQKKQTPSSAISPSPDVPLLGEVLDNCHEYQSLFPTPHPDWNSLHSVAERLHPMMGIDGEVFAQARRVLGKEQAVTVVLCMLENMHAIRRPGAYLRGLCQRAERGLFNLPGMLKAVQQSRLDPEAGPALT